MAKNTSVIGIYPERTTVLEAINVLQKLGYRASDIAVLVPDNHGSKDFGHEKHCKAPEGAAMGTVIGALVVAGIAWLVSTQTVVIIDLAPLAAAGPVLAALAGAGAGGALGWIIGFLAGLRLPEYVAKRYVGRIRHGGILVSVHCDSPEWCDRAKKALKDTGARKIASAPESAADYATMDRPAERIPATIVLSRVAAPSQPTVRAIGETRGVWRTMQPTSH